MFDFLFKLGKEKPQNKAVVRKDAVKNKNITIDRIGYHNYVAEEVCLEKQIWGQREPDENKLNRLAGKHIGIFVAWLAKRHLLTGEFPENIQSEIRKVQDEFITGTDYLVGQCDGRLRMSDVDRALHPFIEQFYREYYESYADVFSDGLYTTEFSWDDYHLLEPNIDKLYSKYSS